MGVVLNPDVIIYWYEEVKLKMKLKLPKRFSILSFSI
jgi:hypothetical protein